MDGTGGRGYSRHFESVNEFQKVSEGTATDILQLLSGLPVILHLGRTDCQGFNFLSQWMEPLAGHICNVSNPLLMNSTQFQIELREI